MSGIFMVLSVLAFLSLPILFIILLVSLFKRKNQKKSALSLLLALVVFITSVCLMPASESNENNENGEDVVQTPVENTEKVPGVEGNNTDNESPVVAMPEDVVIYSNYGIEVVCKKINGLKTFNYEIKNSGDCDITYYIGGFAINDCMVTNLMAVSPITMGNKVVDQYDISGLKDYGIKEIEKVGIYFVFQNDKYETIDNPICYMELSEKDQYFYSVEDTMFYEDENISAYLRKTGDDYKDIDVIYHNKTNSNLTAMLTEVSINGVMLSYDAMTYGDILPGCYAYTGANDGVITLWDALESEVKSKGLNPINLMQAKLKMIGDGLTEYIVISDSITIYDNAE